MDEIEPYETENYTGEIERMLSSPDEENSVSQEALELAQRLTNGDRYDAPLSGEVEEQLEDQRRVRLPGENGTVVVSDGDIVSARYRPQGVGSETGFETEVDSTLDVEVSANELEVADRRAGGPNYFKDIL